MFDELRINRLLKKLKSLDLSDDRREEIANNIKILISKVSFDKRKDFLKKAIELNVYNIYEIITEFDEIQDLEELLKNNDIANEYDNKRVVQILNEIVNLEDASNINNSRILSIISNLSYDKLVEILRVKPEFIKYYYSDKIDINELIDFITSNNIIIDYEELFSNYSDQISLSINPKLLHNKKFVNYLLDKNPDYIWTLGTIDDETEELIYQKIKTDKSIMYYYRGNYPKTIELIKETIKQFPVYELNNMVYANDAVMEVLEELIKNDPDFLFKIDCDSNIFVTLSDENIQFLKKIINDNNVLFSYDKVSKWLEHSSFFLKDFFMDKALNDDDRNIQFCDSFNSYENIKKVFELIKKDFSNVRYMNDIHLISIKVNGLYDEFINYIKESIDSDLENVKYIVNLLDNPQITDLFIGVLNKDFTVMKYFENNNINETLLNKINKKIDKIAMKKIKELPDNCKYYNGNNMDIYKLIIECGQHLNSNQIKSVLFNKEMFEDNSVFVKELVSIIQSVNSSLSEAEIVDIFKYLITNNNEILRTTNFEIFKPEYLNLFTINNNIDKNLLRVILRYEDMQKNIIDSLSYIKNDLFLRQLIKYNYSLNSNNIFLINDVLVNLKDDMNIKIYNMVTNYLLNNSEQAETLIKNVTYLFSKRGLMCPVESIDDILNYEKKQDDYCKGIIDNVDNIQNIKIIKDSLLLGKFGLTFIEAVELISKYGSNLDIELSQLNGEEIKIIEILKTIKTILECDDKYKLCICYQSIDKNSGLSLEKINILESEIRKMYARHLNKSLLSVTDMKDCNLELQYGVKIYEAFDEENPREFKILLTCLGAYSSYERPDNYRDDWLRPVEKSHGFCTSLISNQMMGTARLNYACLGFTNIPDYNLLLSAPFDIGSYTAARNIVSSHDGSQVEFLFPEEMINQTRHTHNELVIERLVKNGKIYPSYVIYMTENFDPNRLNDLKGEEQKKWDNALQAAKDMGLPIVVVDRGKIMANEEKQRHSLMDSFKSGDEKCDKALYELLIRMENNRAGCREYWNNSIDDIYINNLINEVEKTIIKMIDQGKIEQALKCCDSLMLWINNEVKKFAMYQGDVGSKELGISSIVVKEKVKKIKSIIQNKIEESKNKSVITDEEMELLMQMEGVDSYEQSEQFRKASR